MAISAAALEVRFSSSGSGRVKSELNSLRSATDAANSGFNNLYDSASSGFSKVASGISNMSGALGKIGLAGFAAVMIKGTKAAWDQVDAVQQSSVALRAYEKDASKVDQVLRKLVSFARSDQGKLFQREELFQAAQALKVVGDETENLVEHVKIMGRAVNVGTMGWDELTRVIQRVGAVGKVTSIDIEMLRKAGFELDSTFAGTAITLEELFNVLDRSIPLDTMGDQANTLRGKMITLQTAIRDLGSAFLGVDPATSAFTDGVGSRAVGAIDAATAAFGALKPAVAELGNIFAGAIDGVMGIADAFQRLPQGLQSTIGQIAAAVAVLSMFKAAITAATAAMRLMGLGAFAGLLGPVGLAIAAISIAAGKLWFDYKKLGQATDDLAASTKSLGDAQQNLLLDGQSEQARQLGKFRDLMVDVNTLHEELWQDRVKRETEAGNLSMAQIGVLRKEYIRGTDDIIAFTDAQNKIGAAIQDQRVDVAALMGDVGDLYTRLLLDENYTPAMFDIDFIAISENIGAYGTAADDAADSMDGAAHATQGCNMALLGSDDALARLDARFEAAKQRRLEFIQGAKEMAQVDDPLSQWNLSGHGTEASNLAGEMQNLGRSMDDVFRIVVTNTNAIGSQMQGLDDWATKLIGVKGEYSELDNLLNEGRVSLDQYNAAQDAQTTIMQANAIAQREILAIQAQQAPIMADNAQAMADYLVELREMNDGTKQGATDQLAALALMDNATQGRLQQFMDLGTQLEALGPAGEAAMQGIIDGMVAAGDPMIAVLDNLGLIEQKANGDYSINFDGLDAANADMINLTNSVDALTLALGGKIPVKVDTSGAQTDIDNLGKDQPPVPIMVQPEGVSDEDWQTIVPEGGVKVDVRPEGVDLQEWSTFESLIPPITVPVKFSFDTGTDFVGGAVSDAMSAVAGAGGGPSLKARLELDTSDADATLATYQATEVPDKTMAITGDASDAFSAISFIDMATIQDKTLTILADSSAADTALTNIGNATVADKTLTIWGDNTAAYEAVNNVNSYGVDDKTLYIYGDASDAFAVIEMVNLATVQNKSFTITTNQVTAYSSIGSPRGGVQHLADGGFVRSDFQIVGEDGPELVQLPHGSYVNTASETKQMAASGYGAGANGYSGYGGGSVTIAPNAVNITVNASTDADANEIANLAASRTMQSLTEKLADRRRGAGAS